MENSLLKPNPFNGKLYAEKGDLNAREIFTSVGSALTKWELCETTFASLYTAFVKPTGGTAVAFRAYGAITVSSMHREMIKEAAEVYFLCFPCENLDSRLKALLKLHISASTCRNNITHAIVRSAPIVPGQPPDFFWFPPFIQLKKMK